MVDFYKLATGKTLEELVRPGVRALRERGDVTREEWEVPMNNYERQHLLPVLRDEVFMEHFLYCCSQVGFGAMEASYEWALSRELVPEARRRGLMGYEPKSMRGDLWLEGMRQAKAMRQEHREKQAVDGKGFFAGRTQVTERGTVRHVDVRSAYPVEAAGDPGWLVKDFHVLYRAALDVSESVVDPERVSPPYRQLRAQLERLRPAFGVCEAVRRGAAAAEADALGVRRAWVKLDGRGVPLDDEDRPILGGGQVYCLECGGEGGHDPDVIPGAPVVCIECGGTGIMSTIRAEAWRKKNAEGFAAVMASVCPGCGSLNGLLDDGSCRECPWIRPVKHE